MNNSLDPDFEEFKFSDENKIWKDDALDDIQRFGMFFPYFMYVCTYIFKKMSFLCFNTFLQSI